MKTVQQAAEEKGLTTYDCALPEYWVGKVRDILNREPVGNIVWCYSWDDELLHRGTPVAITKEGEIILGMLATYP